MLLTAFFSLLLSPTGAPSAGDRRPVIFWSSDPVLPGETVLCFGADLDKVREVLVGRLADSPLGPPGSGGMALSGGFVPVRPLDRKGRSLKFVIPAEFEPGVFVVRLRPGPTFYLNRPTVWWAQGDLGLDASPGGWVAAFGKCLGWRGRRANSGPTWTSLPRPS